jgi:hypothetical protein
LASGFTEYLAKPVSMKKLLDEIRYYQHGGRHISRRKLHVESRRIVFSGGNKSGNYKQRNRCDFHHTERSSRCLS